MLFQVDKILTESESKTVDADAVAANAIKNALLRVKSAGVYKRMAQGFCVNFIIQPTFHAHWMGR